MNNLHADQVDKAVEGCAYIVHTATPVPLILLNKMIDSDMQIKNLVEGTLLLLKAAYRHKVKRFVLTSSIEAVDDGAHK